VKPALMALASSPIWHSRRDRGPILLIGANELAELFVLFGCEWAGGAL
jgi:hypothetical protein